jgi:hypothetical protein
MTYNTDKEIVKHFCNDLLPKLITKFKITKKELEVIEKAKIILLKVIK